MLNSSLYSHETTMSLQLAINVEVQDCSSERLGVASGTWISEMLKRLVRRVFEQLFAQLDNLRGSRARFESN